MPYPDSFSSITIPDGSSPLATGSHTEVHQAEVDAIARIEQVLGLDPAGTSSTVADRLAGLGASIDELVIGKEDAGTAASLIAVAVAALEQEIGDLTAADVGADPAGTASSSMTAHLNATDPHPQYTSAAELAAGLATITVASIGAEVAGAAATAQAAAIASSAASLTAHTLAADPHTVYQLKAARGVANGYASLNADAQVDISQTLLTTSDCGSGGDGDLTITGTYYMTRDMRWRKVTISGVGRLILDNSTNVAGGWVARIQILDLTNAQPGCITGKTHDTTGAAGTAAGAGGTNGSAATFYAGTAGGGIRGVVGGNGGTAAGTAGTVAPTGSSVGGYPRLPGGTGGAGSGGAGGAGGAAGSGSPAIEPTVPSEPAVAWSSSATGGAAVTISNGGMPGAGGGGGGGDGTAGGGGGAGGPGNKPLDIRVGRLIVGPLTGLPIINARGGGGGAGGTPAAGNRGGGGGGSGAGGSRVHLSVGEVQAIGVSLPLAGAIDASGGAGGAGGNGSGTGIGGFGGGGGPGGMIVYRNRTAGSVTIVDDTAVQGLGGGSPTGATGGGGGTPRATLAAIS